MPLVRLSWAFEMQFKFDETPLKRVEIKVSTDIETTNPPRAGQLNKTFLHYPILSVYGLYYSLKYNGSSSCFSMNSWRMVCSRACASGTGETKAASSMAVL